MTPNKRAWWLRLIVYLVFWTVAYFTLLGIFSVSAARWQPIDHIYTSIFIFTLLVPVTINDWYLQPRFLNRRKYGIYLVLLIVNTVAGVFLNDLLFSSLIDNILPGYYFISYYTFFDLLRFFSVFVLLSTLIGLSLEWIKSQEALYHASQSEKERVSAEFQALVTQLNPHFLFNSLTILYSLAVKNSSDTPGAILKLSEILRYVIYQSSGRTVTLRSELKILQDFIDLQRYRIHPTTQVDLTESISDENTQIAPMLLLPLLENSFKHGVHGETSNAFIKVNASEQNGHVHFTIINNKPHDAPKTGQGGFGLKNLEQRLRLVYSGKYSLTISETPGTFAVSMQIDAN